MFQIDHERPEDAATIERLLDAAFGPDRHAKASYRYREGVEPDRRLCLVARDGDGRIVGSVRHWPVLVGAAAAPALLLGPLAIAPGHRDRGIGRALVRRGLELAAAAGHRAVLLVGDPAYYRRFSFKPAPPGIVMPGERPERLLASALAPDALGGVAGTIRSMAAAEAGLGSRLRGARLSCPGGASAAPRPRPAPGRPGRPSHGAPRE